MIIKRLEVLKIADRKKYFWLKFRDDFFQDKKIKKLRHIAGGDTYTIIYLKMQLLSLKTDGILIYEEVEDTFIEEIALTIDEDVANVNVTINFLLKNQLLEEIDAKTYLLTDTVKNIGKESESAERVRKFREKNKLLALQCNTLVTKSNTEKEIEIDKEKDINLYGQNPPKEDLTTSAKEVYLQQFETFYKNYPKKVKKKDVEKWFKKNKPSNELFSFMMSKLEQFRASNDWQKEDGQFIPYPTTWLNQKRWEDEVINIGKSNGTGKFSNIDFASNRGTFKGP